MRCIPTLKFPEISKIKEQHFDPGKLFGDMCKDRPPGVVDKPSDKLKHEWVIILSDCIMRWNRGYCKPLLRVIHLNSLARFSSTHSWVAQVLEFTRHDLFIHDG